MLAVMRDYQALIASEGLTIVRTEVKRKHIKFVVAKGDIQFMVVASKTSSDYRAMANMRCSIRRQFRVTTEGIDKQGQHALASKPVKQRRQKA